MTSKWILYNGLSSLLIILYKFAGFTWEAEAEGQENSRDYTTDLLIWRMRGLGLWFDMLSPLNSLALKTALKNQNLQWKRFIISLWGSYNSTTCNHYRIWSMVETRAGKYCIINSNSLIFQDWKDKFSELKGLVFGKSSESISASVALYPIPPPGCLSSWGPATILVPSSNSLSFLSGVMSSRVRIQEDIMELSPLENYSVL